MDVPVAGLGRLRSEIGGLLDISRRVSMPTWSFGDYRVGRVIVLELARIVDSQIESSIGASSGDSSYDTWRLLDTR